MDTLLQMEPPVRSVTSDMSLWMWGASAAYGCANLVLPTFAFIISCECLYLMEGSYLGMDMFLLHSSSSSHFGPFLNHLWFLLKDTVNPFYTDYVYTCESSSVIYRLLLSTDIFELSKILFVKRETGYYYKWTLSQTEYSPEITPTVLLYGLSMDLPYFRCNERLHSSSVS